MSAESEAPVRAGAAVPDDASVRETTILLVRHGATPWTHERRLQGRADIGLSPAGVDDAEALAPLVAAWRPASIVSSPLSRARGTADIIRHALPESARPGVRIDEAWSEHGLGEWEGLTEAEIGPDCARWRAGALVPPGGEDAAVTRTRVRRGLDAAAALDGPVLVVTHGGIIRAALAETVGLAADRLDPVAAPSLTVLLMGRGGARLSRYNLGPPQRR